MLQLFAQLKEINPDAMKMSPYAKDGGTAWGVPEGYTTEAYNRTEDDWDPRDPWVELYDDGPRQWNPEFLATLEAKGVKATFFVIGPNVLQYADYVKAVDQAGHQIGIHIVSETIYTALAIYSVIGKVPRYWRPPHGDIDNRVRAIMSAFGLRIAMWNIDSFDWSIDAGPVAPNGRNWTTENATAVLNNVFKYGHYADPWGYGGDVDKPSTWDNASWLPGMPWLNPWLTPTQGFMSLEHELSDIDHTLSVTYLDTIFNTPYAFANFTGGTNRTDQMFTPALVHECDVALGGAATPYLSDADPFYNLVTYWYTKLPITAGEMGSVNGAPINFSWPLVNATVPTLARTTAAYGYPTATATAATYPIPDPNADGGYDHDPYLSSTPSGFKFLGLRGATAYAAAVCIAVVALLAV
ncbi:chitin deacetylase, partial [Irineochytrium annulatum]